MTWTYDAANLTSATPHKDQVRFLIGDNDSTDPQLADAEITYMLTVNGDVYSAAIGAAQALVARYAREVDKTVGPLSIRASQRAQAYRDVIKTLKDQLSSSLGTGPWSAALSVSAKETYEDDTDIPSPAFVRRMRNDPAAAENTPFSERRL